MRVSQNRGTLIDVHRVAGVCHVGNPLNSSMESFPASLVQKAELQGQKCGSADFSAKQKRFGMERESCGCAAEFSGSLHYVVVNLTGEWTAAGPPYNPCYRNPPKGHPSNFGKPPHIPLYICIFIYTHMVTSLKYGFFWGPFYKVAPNT